MFIFIYLSFVIIIFLFSQYLVDSSPPLIAVSKKFKPDISVLRVRELNFILHSEIFVHFNGLLRVSHLILGCVPSYTSYQDSSSALMVDNPLLSYLDIQLPRFLPPGLTFEEARHLGP